MTARPKPVFFNEASRQSQLDVRFNSTSWVTAQRPQNEPLEPQANISVAYSNKSLPQLFWGTLESFFQKSTFKDQLSKENFNV